MTMEKAVSTEYENTSPFIKLVYKEQYPHWQGLSISWKYWAYTFILDFMKMNG